MDVRSMKNTRSSGLETLKGHPDVECRSK